MLAVSGLPPAEVTNSEHLHFRELCCVLVRDRRIARAVMVLRDQLLRPRCVEKFQVRISHGSRLFLRCIAIYDRYRWLSENTHAGNHDVELPGMASLQREEGFILPIDENVADPALDERGSRSACPGIEHRDISEEPRHELACLALVVAVGTQRITPGSQIIPTGRA